MTSTGNSSLHKTRNGVANISQQTSLIQILSNTGQANSGNTSFNEVRPAADTHATSYRRESREYDTAGWAFKKGSNEVNPSLAFLPIIGLLLLIIYTSLKAYKWSNESSRQKARGDVEFLDDEVNYEILQEGDKNFRHIDIRGDGASLYDTINSFRMLHNGNAASPSYGHHPYQDSVTSYKSLLMQKVDGNQYDSVKSYKAFLQKVTQNKDLATVEVKLLENYPIKSKSAEHFMVVEEESSEKPESLTSKVLSALPLRKQLLSIEKLKKKVRHQSGDCLPGHRKRSQSNPTCRRPTRRTAASSLPSIQCHDSSSDSSCEDTFKEDRKRMWAERKKMCRSTSGLKIAKEHSILASGPARRRHYSADSARRPRKPPGMYLSSLSSPLSKISSGRSKKKCRHGKEERKDSEKSETSENPTSSHSSCDNSDIKSDVIDSYSNEEEDDDTKLCTHLSNLSDDQTIEDNDVFLSIDPVPSPSPRQLLARAKEDFFTEAPRPTYIDLQKLDLTPVETFPVNHDYKNKIGSQDNIGSSFLPQKSQLKGSPLIDNGKDNILRTEAAPLSSTEIQSMQSPRRVQRFHVTFVSSDISSLNSE